MYARVSLEIYGKDKYYKNFEFEVITAVKTSGF